MKLHVLASPNAKRSEVCGWEEDSRAGRVLRVRIAVPPVDGKANEELRKTISAWLGLPKSAVVLAKGGTSRVKTFTVPDDVVLPL